MALDDGHESRLVVCARAALPALLLSLSLAFGGSAGRRAAVVGFVPRLALGRGPPRPPFRYAARLRLRLASAPRGSVGWPSGPPAWAISRLSLGWSWCVSWFAAPLWPLPLLGCRLSLRAWPLPRLT